MESQFEAQPECEAMLRSVGIQPGWRVLAAGNEHSCFVPVLCELVGPCGWITVRDASATHLANVQAQLYETPPPCRVDTELGPLDALPQPARAFDAIWCADVSRHLSDAELKRTLTEFVRVLLPGGLLAVEDIDIASMRTSLFQPMRLLQDLSSIESRVAWIHGALRAATLDRELEAVGLRQVRKVTTLVSRHAPLEPADRQYIGSTLSALTGAMSTAVEAGRDADRAWRILMDPGSRRQSLDRPDFDWREGHVMAIGRAAHPGY